MISSAKCFIYSALIVVTTFAKTCAQTVPDSHGGLIFFTALDSPPESFGNATILKQTELNNRSNLFITVFLKATLSSYLKELAPALPMDSLSKIGNYQFSFFVDNRLVYRIELLPGAPRPQQQQTQVAWSKPLIDNNNEGAWWSQSAWNRFMFNGGDKALTDGLHNLKIVFRPYLKLPELLVGPVIAEGQIDLVVKRKPAINVEKVKLSSPQAYVGLPISTETFDRDKIKMLKAYIDANVFRHVTSVVVIKNGKLLMEEYFNGSSRDSLHDVRSASKSLISTLIGMALRDGYVHSVDQKLAEFYDVKAYLHPSTAKSSVTLKELMNMNSRFDGNDADPNSPGNEENMYPSADWVKFALNLPMDTIKYIGQWHYFTTGVMLLGSTLHRLVPGGLKAYAQKQLFGPLDISHYNWQYTPQHVVNTSGGLRINSLDLAKYGQLYVNNGSWNDKQLLPKDWVAQTFSHHLPIDGRENEYYGYLFWNKTYRSKGKDYETYYAAGNGGNHIHMFKEQQLVVVITATAYGSAYAHTQVLKNNRP